MSRTEARRPQIPAYEMEVFRRVNGASDRIRVPVRAIMQAGTFGTVPAVSVLALLFDRKRLGPDGRDVEDRDRGSCKTPTPLFVGAQELGRADHQPGTDDDPGPTQPRVI